MPKKALICGVSGQDGSYLARLLLEKGYEVYGGSRDAQLSSFSGLKYLGVLGKVSLLSININDFRSTLQTLIKVKPDEIYNLAGQSSVGLSFEQPVETLESITIGSLNLLESIRFSGSEVKLYNAGSSECFGDTGQLRANENTPFRPRSPYAVAKSAAFWELANYREAYNIFACTGILFNHESPLRSERFVTRKIISTACRIYKGSKEILKLGNLEIARDWGWAPEYVEAMWIMLQQRKPDDYIVATGKTRALRDFVKITFDFLGLNWENHVTTDTTLYRPTDLMEGWADTSKASEQLGWKAQKGLSEVIELMIKAELELTYNL